MSQRSRTDLCGGCRATGIPTATSVVEASSGSSTRLKYGEFGLEQGCVVSSVVHNTGRRLLTKRFLSWVSRVPSISVLWTICGPICLI